MMKKTEWKAFLWAAALAASACGKAPDENLNAPAQETVQTVHQQINSTNKVLILGSSVNGGLSSREAQAVAAIDPTTQIDVVSPGQWKNLTAQQFMAYKALIIGDDGCKANDSAFQAAVENRFVWGDVVDGDIAILSTNPTSNNTPQLVENAIKFVLNSQQKRTGMYISLGCAYQNATTAMPVALLEPFGSFMVQGVPGCADSAHMIEMHSNDVSNSISDPALAANGCAARSVFTQYPDHNFSFAGLAMSASGKKVPGARPYPDFVVDPGQETHFVSTPYVLVRGAMPQASGCGTPDQPATEECDLGDDLNGQPQDPAQPLTETCSYSCHRHWCGDGIVDASLGEECDQGLNNGRSMDASGNPGTCTASCKLPHAAPPPPPPPASHAPVALCHNVTAVAQYSCSESANIDNGSYDQDNDLVGCTQSPAGPYGVGKTAVTLTCTDRANNSSTCTGEVTVLDTLPPTLSLNGPDAEQVECAAGGTYHDPGATATDLCEGSLPVKTTGSVNLGMPGSYTLTYGATDSSGNQAAPLSHTVMVEDTQPPQLQVRPGPSDISCNSTYVDPGATASDACAGDLTSKIVTTSNVDTTQSGQYTVTYRVTDGVGHQSTASRQLTVGPCGSGNCLELHLSDYNLFLLESYTGGHDVEGKVAAGGDITMTDFSVGWALPSADTANTLVAGGKLKLSRGGIWGDARYGDQLQSDKSVVFPRGAAAQGTPIDFAARFAELHGVSSQLASRAANGSTVRTGWGGILLHGTDANVNVFNVDASAFTGAKLLSIDAPAGSLVVVNIRGASATFTGFGIQFSGGINQHGVVYNFVDTTHITANGFGFWGTVLAPLADVSFSNGSWDGGLYAKSLSGNAEGHLNGLYEHSVCPPPAPMP
ncbi:MAG: choice-of-anchor A family protein [Hyalangium sp.]|uniref:choice-of-anchor A family protein n=1 Tax=Hyalangium sp. TaxID=2028555 RepID=UPI00389A875B